LLRVLRSRLEMVKLAREWRHWSRRIAEAAREVLGDCEVYVFGSVAEGEEVGGSDVDILIVSSRVPDKQRRVWELKARIEERAGLPPYHPYELHLVNEEEAKWYFKHVRKLVRIA